MCVNVFKGVRSVLLKLIKMVVLSLINVYKTSACSLFYINKNSLESLDKGLKV